MLFYFYCMTNLTNNKIYVGITNEPSVRWKTHNNIAKGGKEKYPQHFQAVHSAIVKYGSEQFSFEISKVFSDEDEAYFYEEDFISYMRELKVPNYNIAGGGKGTGSGLNHPMFGKTLPQEWKDKVTAATKIRSNLPEVKEANRKRMIERNWVGENHPNFGKTTSTETSNKISEKLTGVVFTSGHKSKISKSLTGRYLSDEHKNNISLSKAGKHIGTNNPNSKLSTDDLQKIYNLLDESMSSRKIGKIFNVSKTTILRVKKSR